MQFGDKVRLAVGILRFVNIRSDTGSGSADLIGNDRFVLAFQDFYKIQNLYRKYIVRAGLGGLYNFVCTFFCANWLKKFPGGVSCRGIGFDWGYSFAGSAERDCCTLDSRA